MLLAFVLCWLPNQALTLWGLLVKLNVVPWDRAYFLSQAFLFPLSICLARSNNCLNPMLYCLLRRDFRQGLRELCGRPGQAPHGPPPTVLRLPCPSYRAL